MSSPHPGTRARRGKHPSWEHPIGSRIRIAEIPNRNKGRTYGSSFEVRFPASLFGHIRGRERVLCRSKAAAHKLAEDRLASIRRHGTELSRLPANVQREAAVAWEIPMNTESASWRRPTRPLRRSGRPGDK